MVKGILQKSGEPRGRQQSHPKSNFSGGVRFSPGSDGATSQRSKRSRRSGMTRNPLHFEQNVLKHTAPGIDDKESHLYKDFDYKGRIEQTFQQRAAIAGVKALETNQFRKDSPIRMTLGRFPEKYDQR